MSNYKFVVNPAYGQFAGFVESLPHCFETEGEVVYTGRNVVKLFEIGGQKLVVKVYKRPLLYQRIDYTFIRKSKARRAYDYAREGEQVEMRKALVNIFEIEILELQMPLLRIRVRCSKGTYIRSLAIEIGEALGSGAHLVGLRRTRSGETRVEDCQPLADAVRALGGEWTEREGRIMGRDKREANDELRIEN
jgi:tRNA pseudouridine(55) synthase